ncbi:MAG: molybdopterin-dependent oxidoreductase [Bacteroidetes bacterium]|jgi:anaerobic selenocysteine-containing dehydrogenase|nr:molybdopterin-dependent oxidoreductase [Bacteroidota bacterium]MBT6685592.1 molybdopterin-dependent oxidoreductase [Bacteroidota bacterium]MBT7142681.1 molybdopterin-dependent oxidoreductase [Bacteroidota bacterium]MBT7490919.1 molybdopterin-dependent oxidoreductase [Bacteroidota bacterium]
MKNQNNRREFIRKTAFTGAGLTVGLSMFSGLKSFAQSDKSSSTKSAAPKGKWISTTCQGCTSWCSQQVYVVNGRAIKVRGNANSKVNLGQGCVRSHLSLQQVYDPDRIKVPMKRTNPKKGRNEDPKFVPITWDEALNTIADKILDLRKNNETHKYMLMRGRYSYMRDLIYDRMTKIIGSPNNISHSSICAEAEKFGPYYTEGEWDYRQYDIMNSKYILIWGADPLSANRQVSYYSASWGDALDDAQVAVVDPRLSITATKATDWLPVVPGQDGALASAFAHVILTKGLWNKEFVGDFDEFSPVNNFKAGQEINEEYEVTIEGKTFKGTTFNETHAYGLLKWWNIELKNKTPKWASKLSGIPEEQIIRVATQFAEAAPHAISWVGGGPVMQARGGYASMACHALNGLVGSVDNVGGCLKANKEYTGKFPSPKDFMDEIAQEGVHHKKIDHRGRKEFPNLKKGKSGKGVVTNNAAEGILNEDPNEIKVAIGYFNNFAFSCPQSERWERALSKIPFLVHFTTNGSEFTHFADVVLPCAHHMYEKWGYVKNHANGYRHVTLLQPVIEPIWDVKIEESEIPWLIAEKLAEKGFSNLMNYYKSIKDPETGKQASNEKEFALFALKYATENLWNPEKYHGGDKFSGWKEFSEVGVWNSDPYKFKKRWSHMKTKTKKFEFYSETLKAALEAHASKHETNVDDILNTCNYQARGELAYVPHYEAPFLHGDADEFPLVHVDFKSRFNREGRSANCTWYHELKDLDPGDEMNEDVARFNPVDAKKYGLSNGDKIKLISKVGELECTAKVWEGTRPGTVSKCYGQGHWAYGKVASEEYGKKPRGGNNNAIIPAEYDRLSGATAFYGTTRVKVVKVVIA